MVHSAQLAAAAAAVTAATAAAVAAEAARHGTPAPVRAVQAQGRLPADAGAALQRPRSRGHLLAGPSSALLCRLQLPAHSARVVTPTGARSVPGRSQAAARQGASCKRTLALHKPRAHLLLGPLPVCVPGQPRDNPPPPPRQPPGWAPSPL